MLKNELIRRTKSSYEPPRGEVLTCLNQSVLAKLSLTGDFDEIGFEEDDRVDGWGSEWGIN